MENKWEKITGREEYKCYIDDVTWFLIDSQDYCEASQHHWYLHHGSPCTTKNRKCVTIGSILRPSCKRVMRRNSDVLDFRSCNMWYGNVYTPKADYVEMECFDGSKVKVDFDDVGKISAYQWHIDSNGYVIGKVKGKQTKLHRYILGLQNNDPREVDHIHHDLLDVRKTELRIVTRGQNMQNCGLRKSNTSGATGVYWNASAQKWCVQIGCDGNKQYLGSFTNIDEAIMIRQQAEVNLHKEFRYT